MLYLSFFVGQKIRVFHKRVQLSVRFVATVHTSDVLYCAVVKSKDYLLIYLLLCIYFAFFQNEWILRIYGWLFTD